MKTEIGVIRPRNAGRHQQLEEARNEFFSKATGESMPR